MRGEPGEWVTAWCARKPRAVEVLMAETFASVPCREPCHDDARECQEFGAHDVAKGPLTWANVHRTRLAKKAMKGMSHNGVRPALSPSETCTWRRS